VGVPPVAENDPAPCEGSGAEIAESGCLDRGDMQLVPTEFVDESNQVIYTHLAPSCTRTDSESGNAVTVARPGRRFVKVAEDFGANGFVASICNEDWGPSLLITGEAIASKLTHPCFPHQAPWIEQEAGNCPTCGVVSDKCDLFIEYKDTEENFECPAALYADLDDDEKDVYLGKAVTETIGNATRTYCAVQKVAAPISRAETAEMEGLSDEIGWTYCEDGGICDYSIDTTPAARDIARGHLFAYRCVAEIQ
jgi:hypothetical protein